MNLPLLRSIYRRLTPQTMQIRLAALRHRARHLPSRGDPRFRRSQERLARLRDAHAGEVCVIIGNGPSMRGFDLETLDGIKTFCLNRGYLLWQEQGRVPDYLVSVNRLVIEQYARELQGVGSTLFAPWLLSHNFEPGDSDAIFFEERWDDAFITDACEGVSSLATVTNTALQLAWHMGFSQVVLIGVDHHFSAASRGQPHEMIVQNGDDADHFDPSYFAEGTRWHLPDLVQSERGYRLVRAQYEAAGRHIVDATQGGRCDVFEKAELSDILTARRSGSTKNG